MDPQKYQRAKQVFEEAIDLDSAQVRGFLDDACKDDAALRELVERLLGWDDTHSDLDVASLGGVAVVAEAQSVDTLEAGQLIDGRYMVDRHLGAGGMASVWRVRHLRLNAWYAIKILALPHDFLRDRLLQEGQLQGRVAHRNVVSVTDMLDLGGQPALVMEFVEGPSLAEFLRAGRPTEAQIDQIARGLLAGVGAAHEAGLVHRDLKPANVLLATEDGQLIPKVADFGIARLLNPDDASGPGLTRTGALMGTPAYMSPEQIRDARSIDHRADIWALGCILHELITGERAFVGEDNGEILTAVLTGAVSLPQASDYDVPEHWVGAVVEALRVKPDARPESCAALLAFWDGAVSRPPPPPPPTPWPGRIAALSLVVLIGAGGGMLWRAQTTPPEDPAPLEEAAVPVEAVAEEPAVAEPAVAEPAVAEPVVEEPEVAEPVVVEPAVAEPEVEEAPAVESPAVVAEPAVAEPVAVAEPDEPTSTGAVSVSGAAEAWLVSGGQRFGLSDVPPGTYEVWVRFSAGDEPTQGLKGLTVTAGQTSAVSCNKVFTLCKQ